MSELRILTADRNGKVFCEDCGTVHHQEYMVLDDYNREWCVECAALKGILEPEIIDKVLDE